MDKIKVYATADSTKQFEGKEEFSLQLIKGIRYPSGELDLLKTIQYILQEEKTDLFVLCQDDHVFTADYSKEYLKNAIRDALAVNADIVCGGVNWFRGGMATLENLFWIETFSGSRFVVIFKSLYDKLSGAERANQQDTADYVISGLTDRIFVMHPFISTENSHHALLYQNASETIHLLKNIRNSYAQ